MKTLELLKDYAETTDNVWLKNKLDVLKAEINLEITKAEIKAVLNAPV